VTVVVDANIAIKWVVNEADSAEAVSLYESWTRRSELLIAPPIFRPEVTNVIHRKVRLGEINLLVAVDAIESLLMAVSIHEPERLYTNALSLAQAIDLSATYDSLYLALAEAERCDFWTADKRFVNAVGHTSKRVRWLGELAPEK